MHFVDENNNHLILELFVYTLHAYIYLHKKFYIVLIILNWLINLSVFKCLLWINKNTKMIFINP
jgi:hypothetical protein